MLEVSIQMDWYPDGLGKRAVTFNLNKLPTKRLHVTRVTVVRSNPLTMAVLVVLSLISTITSEYSFK